MDPKGATTPTFFVIGAPKCGTTSLHFYLGQHPEIDMTLVKEPQIFAGDDYRARLEEYGALFEQADAPARGESSAVYSQHPRWGGVPERIRSTVPDARFVYLVRDPVERAEAHYHEHLLAGKERRSIEEALADWRQPDSLFLCPSRYATQVRRYLGLFAPARMLIVDRGDLLAHRDSTLARIFEFLGVDPSFVSPRFEERLNVGEERRSPTSLGRWLRPTRAYEAAKRVPLPGAVRDRLERLVKRPLTRPQLDGALRERIADSLREEVEWLRAFSGQEFAGWSV
jgi:hypothetical protein